MTEIQEKRGVVQDKGQSRTRHLGVQHLVRRTQQTAGRVRALSSMAAYRILPSPILNWLQAQQGSE